MSSLTSILSSKQQTFSNIEQNLERGQISVYVHGNQLSNLISGFCWQAPSTGIAVIEMWGGSGSSAKMCCCGFGIPGNPGAYSKKTIEVRAGNYICGGVGRACANSNDLGFRGCSDSSTLTWFGRDCNGQTTGCMCAQGGRGGLSICTTAASAWCCFYAAGFCGTKTLNDNCGVICNYCVNGVGWNACAYGGDFNCCGGFSCMSFFGCQSACMCLYQTHLAVSPGVVSTKGTVLTFGVENSNEFANWSGQGIYQAMNALNAVSRWPSQGTQFASPWGFSGACGCYDNDGCVRNLPVGVPAPPPYPCVEVRDHAHAGGDGAVRIKFIAS